MTEHLTPERMSGYGRRSLSPADLLTVDDHLVECAACRGGMSDEAGVQMTIAALLLEILSAAPSPAAARAVESHPLREPVPAPTLAPTPAPVVAPEPEPILTGAAPQASAAPRTILLVAAILIAVLLGLAAAGAWRRSSALARRLADSEARLIDLRASNEGLAGQAAELQSLRAEIERARSEDAAPPAAAPALMTIQDRHGPVGIDADGNLVGFDALSLADGRVITAALKAGAVGTPDGLPELLEGAATLAGVDGEAGFALLAPVGTAVRGARPTFNWRPLEGSAEYTVELFDAAGGRLGGSDPLQGTRWTPDRPLRRGGVYSWRVTARLGTEEIVLPAAPASGARFRVLGGDAVTALDRSARAARGSRLAFGILAARACLLDESERELRALLQSNRSSPPVDGLLRSVEALRRPSQGGG